MTVRNLTNDVLLTNFVCTNLPFDAKEKISLLSTTDMRERAMELLKLMNRQIQLQQLKNDIRRKTKVDLDEQQKEYFLQQQMKNIKEELGEKGNNPERARLEEGAKKKEWPASVAQHFRQRAGAIRFI